MDQGEWTAIFGLEEIEVGGARLYKSGGRQIAVFRTTERDCFAVDNLCPHEGYPLLGGPVKDCVITCPWHNYKFRLDNGKCVKGEEDVRSYALRITDGRIEIDLAEPDPALVFGRLEVSLADGLWRGNLGQVARDILRWLEAGGRPEDLALICARFDARYAEWGTTHALAVAVDALSMAEAREGSDRVLPLLYAFEEASDEQRRREPRPVVPPSAVPQPCWEDMRKELLGLVETERADDALAFLGMLLQEGVGAETLAPWFQELCAEHFLGFGHPLIYVSKAFALLDRVGFEHASEILPALLLRILRSTRESLLPEWSRWRADMERIQARLPELWKGIGSNVGESRPEEASALRHAVLDGSSEEAFAAMLGAVEAGWGLDAMLEALSLAAAGRLLRFDTHIEEDPGIQEGWLHVTHRFTFVNAIRNCSIQAKGPWILSLFFQAAHWIQAAKPLDRAAPGGAQGQEEGALREASTPDPAADPLATLLRCIGVGDSVGALSALGSYLDDSDPGRVQKLRTRLEDLVLSGAAVRPIVSAHLIKTLVAAFQEASLIRGPDFSLPLQAYVRLLASPLVENVLPRRVHEAVGFVIHGRVPKTLT